MDDPLGIIFNFSYQLGLITRVGFLDHAAHLGGMLFGIWWIKEGYKFVKPAVKLWDEEIRDQVISKR